MITLEFPHPTGYLHQELQRVIDLVAFGLQAANTYDSNEFSIPGLPFHIVPSKVKVRDIEDARIEFKSWVLGNGLRECVEAVGPMLEWARRYCFLWSCSGELVKRENGSLALSAHINGEKWNREVVHNAKKFESMGLPNKLDHLNQKFNFNKPELTKHILSLNKARNCLSHRKGVVGGKT